MPNIPYRLLTRESRSISVNALISVQKGRNQVIGKFKGVT